MRYVIIGNGVAGVNAARAIAGGDHPKAEVIIYSRERYHYYPRPRLPFFLAGEMSLAELILYPPEWYERRGIEVYLEKEVAEIRPADKELLLADGTNVPYDRLLLANGSSPSVPPFKGAGKRGVFTMRTVDDALAIQDFARHAERAIVIGGGLLGLEAARALSVLGPKITIVEFFERLLPRQLDVDGAGLLQRLIEGMGMEVITGAATEEILGAEEATGIRLKDGREISADMVLISAGIRCNTELARAAGLEVTRGVVVDNTMHTSAPDIWAAGDVAECAGRVWGIVIAATEQARVAAANMTAGEGSAPALYEDIVPSNTLKVVGIDLTSIGTVNPEGPGYEEVRAMDEAAGRYEKLVLKDGRIVGAILLGNKERVRPVSDLITRKVDVSAHAGHLLDDAFDLGSLLG